MTTYHWISGREPFWLLVTHDRHNCISVRTRCTTWARCEEDRDSLGVRSSPLNVDSSSIDDSRLRDCSFLFSRCLIDSPIALRHAASRVWSRWTRRRCSYFLQWDACFTRVDVLDVAFSGMITRTPEKYATFVRHARSTYATTKILYLNCRRDIRIARGLRNKS